MASAKSAVVSISYSLALEGASLGFLFSCQLDLILINYVVSLLQRIKKSWMNLMLVAFVSHYRNTVIGSAITNDWASTWNCPFNASTISRFFFRYNQSFLRFTILENVELLFYELHLQDLIAHSRELREDTKDLQKAHEFMLALPQRLTDSKFIENLSGYKGNIHKLGRLLRHVSLIWIEFLLDPSRCFKKNGIGVYL